MLTSSGEVTVTVTELDPVFGTTGEFLTVTVRTGVIGGGGGGAVADATAVSKGVVQLAGDLAGTAAAPTVPGLASKLDADDPSVGNARAPIVHAASHGSGGTDPVAVAQSQVTGLAAALAALLAAADLPTAVSGLALTDFPAGLTRDSELAAAVAALVDASPGALDTLNELAAAIGDDPNFAATLTALVGTKVDKATLDANSLLKADVDDTPTALAVAASTLVGRGAAGGISALTVAQVKTLLAYVAADITDATAVGRALLTAADVAAQRTALGLGSAAVLSEATVKTEVIGVALSDETTAITTGTAKATIRMPFAMTVTAVRASLTTASSSGLPTVDINEGGTSILSTKLTVDATEKTSTTAVTPAVISDASLADDAEVTFDVDVAGTGATGLKVWLIGTRA